MLCKIVCPVVAFGGFFVIGWGTLADGVVDDSDLRGLGIGMVLGAMLCFFAYRKRKDESAIYEMGRQSGYDAGWRDARRAGSLTLVDRRHPASEEKLDRVNGHCQ